MAKWYQIKKVSFNETAYSGKGFVRTITCGAYKSTSPIGDRLEVQLSGVELWCQHSSTLDNCASKLLQLILAVRTRPGATCRAWRENEKAIIMNNNQRDWYWKLSSTNPSDYYSCLLLCIGIRYQSTPACQAKGTRHCRQCSVNQDLFSI